jgi:hypothetical protein
MRLEKQHAHPRLGGSYSAVRLVHNISNVRKITESGNLPRLTQYDAT